jgi:hypothetical protein
MSKLKIASLLLLIFLVRYTKSIKAQGLNSHYLLGYTTGIDTNVISNRGVFQFDSLGYALDSANFKMPFRAAQGTLSDESGNLLMVSNGCWIADATGDTMLNGGGLIPNTFTSNWCNSFTGIPYPHAALFLPFPDDSNKVVLLHQSGTSSSNFYSDGLYYSIIDKSLNNGLGGVLSGQKNIKLPQTDLIPGMAACKHANGRDWWIVVFEHNSDLIYVYILTPLGISLNSQQNLGITPNVNLGGQKAFSPDGKKFAHIYYQGPTGNVQNYIRIFDFDRCNGAFSNSLEIVYTKPLGGVGISFSPNSKFLYATNFDEVYQVNLDTINVAASMKTVAINDGYYSPLPPLQTNFWMTYPAADGKIYISSGNSVIDMHFINYPDSNGISCDVQQHAVRLPCYAFRSHVYHPNYYLGCDTTLGCPCLVSTGVSEYGQHDFSIKLSPNPGSMGFEILYLLPQNKNGTLSVYDLQGRLMHKQILPQWSTMQHIPASNWAGGVYQVRVESDGCFSSNKWVKY